MKQDVLGRSILLLAIAIPVMAAIPEAQRTKIDEVTGTKGSYSAEEDVYRVTFPRVDVKVGVEGRSLHPFLGLTSWAAFTSAEHGELMVMGDLVLFEDEVNPVMSAALDNGLEVTALHSHFFYDSPKVMFMHIGGNGPAERLATAVRRAMDQVKAIRAARALPGTRFAGPAIPDTNSITAANLDRILGVKGQVNSGMYKATIGRKATMHGKNVGSQMGVNTWAAFAGSDDAAFVDGDFAMLKAEVQPVLKTLRKAGIQIVAIHNHMTHEEPQYIFLHYWGKGAAATLATALRAALDVQQPRARNSSQVVFVCEHGAAKSVIASAYFNKLATERGLPYRSIATGVVPDPVFNPATIAGLRQDGFAPLQGEPRKLAVADGATATHVVTLGAELPHDIHPASRLEWNDTPSVNADYGAARDSIRRNVEALIERLTKK